MKRDFIFFRDACDRIAASRDGWLSFVTPSLNWKIRSEIKVDSRKKMNLSWSLVMNGSHSGQFPLIWNSLKLVSDELTLTLVWAIHHEYPLQIHYILWYAISPDLYEHTVKIWEHIIYCVQNCSWKCVLERTGRFATWIFYLCVQSKIPLKLFVRFLWNLPQW